MTVYGPSSGGRDSAVPIRDYQLPEYMYRRFPDVVRADDVRHGQTVRAVLDQLPDLDVSNVPEAVMDEPQLLRFLRVYGALWNALRSEVVHATMLFDPLRAEGKWLPYISHLLGWELNTELPIDKQRAELLSVMEIYRRKGRTSAIDYLIEQLTDFDFRYEYGRDRILVMWVGPENLVVNPESHLFQTGEEASIGLLTDENYYFWGRRDDSALEYKEQYILLYLTQNLLDSNAFLITEKISRLGDDMLAWGVELVIITDAFYGEPEYDLGAIDETDHIETYPPDQLGWLSFWVDPSQSPRRNTGTLWQLDEENSWLLWYLYLTEENFSDPPVIDSDGNLLPPP